uniref:Uncharacterized protein n=1 Tax=Fagus sylvatica TaxID=28930 RepID=A0A2N9J598_FAGSY
MVQTEATGIFLRFPTPIAHISSTSPKIASTGGSSRIQELLKGSFHLRHSGFVEAREVNGFQTFWRDNVRDGGEADVIGLRIGADVAEPLLGDDKATGWEREKMGEKGKEERGESRRKWEKKEKRRRDGEKGREKSVQ